MSETPAVSRRLLLGSAAAGGALAAGIGAAAPAASAAAEQAPRRRPGQKSMIGVPFAAHGTVRVGIIGLGNRGGSMITGWAAVPGCTVTAVCDIRADRARSAADRLEGKGHPRPAEYGGSADSYARMLRRDDIDLVYVATPWEYPSSTAAPPCSAAGTPWSNCPSRRNCASCGTSWTPPSAPAGTCSCPRTATTAATNWPC
ncbi:hypothetical protein STENM223S_06194 [Streptomyces tendae]